MFKCSSKSCKICRLYLMEGTEVEMSNGTMWKVKCFANCHSLNVLYYLTCGFCKVVTYIGKTNNFRQRTNNHISSCRHGNSTDQFDNHVYDCWKEKNDTLPPEPFFIANILMVCNDYNKLLSHEAALHAKGLDTMNT